MPHGVQVIQPPATYRADISAAGGAYAAEDALGGMLTLDGLMRFNVWSGAFVRLTVDELASQQKPAIDFIFFNRPFTAPGNNNPCTFGASDAANILGVVSIQNGDWVNFGTTGAIATKIPIGFWYKIDPVATGALPYLYCQPKIGAGSTPTWTTPNPVLVVRFTALPD
jgi:hypothetical protein